MYDHGTTKPSNFISQIMDSVFKKISNSVITRI